MFVMIKVLRAVETLAKTLIKDGVDMRTDEDNDRKVKSTTRD